MNKIYQKNLPGNKNAGFTLIELLVVVLIIGILAAVAVPQYQTAVARARYKQLMLMGTAIAKAEQIYYLANGEYTTDFSALDLDFGESAQEENGSGSFSAIRGPWGMCALRDYAVGTIQCSSHQSSVPEFNIYNGFTTRQCYAYYSGGDVPERVCKLETGRTEPSGSSESAAWYLFP